MTDLERNQRVHALLLIISVITGWEVPQSTYLDILIDQLTKKFTESYANVNPDEVEYAFRNNSVKDWGKAMNLNLIDEVMAPYLNQRFELSRIEEATNKHDVKLLPPIEMTDEDLLNATYECYKVVKKPDFIPEALYFYLEKEGRIALTNAEKRHIMDRVGDDKALCRKVAVADYFKKLMKDL